MSSNEELEFLEIIQRHEVRVAMVELVNKVMENIKLSEIIADNADIVLDTEGKPTMITAITQIAWEDNAFDWDDWFTMDYLH